MKELLKTIGGVLLVLFVIGLVGAVIDDVSGRNSVPDQTQQSKETTWRNSFISGCTEDGTVTRLECGCAYDELKEIHPDIGENETTIKRILQEGYSQDETDAMVPCFTGDSV